MQIKTLSTIEVLQTMDDGGALEELREALLTVAKAVNERGGKGAVTLRLNFEKRGKNQLEITDQVSFTVPKVAKDPKTFFATQDGQLTRQDVNQMSFDDITT